RGDLVAGHVPPLHLRRPHAQPRVGHRRQQVGNVRLVDDQDQAHRQPPHLVGQVHVAQRRDGALVGGGGAAVPGTGEAAGFGTAEAARRGTRRGRGGGGGGFRLRLRELLGGDQGADRGPVRLREHRADFHPVQALDGRVVPGEDLVHFQRQLVVVAR